jgi:medium-chain acyl-[acyl-carrier-protein] hydrolase
MSVMPVTVESSSNNAAKWFLRASTRSAARIRIFCFPYAGGAASIYRGWASFMPPGVEIIPVELPGRGRRLAEPPIRRMAGLVAALTPVIAPLLDTKFAFFGHSMGALIAFELARELRRRRGLMPEQVFISGRSAPQVRDSEAATYALPEDEFRAELKRLNGTPVEALENAELMSLMLPYIRADFELVQTYKYYDDAPLRCRITAYGGLEDRAVTREALLRWQQHTQSQFSLHMLPGDHFFLRSATQPLLELLRPELLRIIALS